MLARATVELQVANGALAHIGEGRLSSLDENRPAARAIKDNFGAVRDALLRRLDWNFARRRAVLARDASAPAGSFAYAYPLPGDCVRVHSAEGLDDAAWSIEAPPGRTATTPLQPMLYTDATAVAIRYTARIDHVSLWDALFLEIFELELAAKIAGLVGSGDGAALRDTAAKRLATARRIDAREAARGSVSREVPFITVRR